MALQPRKQHLIDTAYRLFNEFGYHATGIDRILLESGVSKATLYKHFRSKEALILAVLEQRHTELTEQTEAGMSRARALGEPEVLAIFDGLDQWFQTKGFFGCNFINASAEYGQRGEAIHDFAALHKERLRCSLERSLQSASPELKVELSEQLMMLFEGAIVSAHVRGKRNAAQVAKKAAQRLVACHKSNP